jgi:hypothetical protein
MRQAAPASQNPDQTQRMPRQPASSRDGDTAIVPAPVMGYPPSTSRRDPFPGEDDFYAEGDYYAENDPYAADDSYTDDDYYAEDDYYTEDDSYAEDDPYVEGPDASQELAAQRAGAGLGGRKAMLVGGAVAGTLLVGALLFAGMAATRSSPAKQTSTGKPTATTPTPPVPSARPSSSGSAKAHRKSRSRQATTSANVVPSIDDARSDPRPLTPAETFPDSEITMAGRAYRQAETSVSGDCALAARGAIVAALRAGRCASVVRAAYLDEGGKYAVTMGIAVFPTKAEAVTVSAAGDPSTYEWFTSMAGAKERGVGGYSASTALGRYLVYSFVESADGTPADVANPALQAVATGALDYASHAIHQRATA